jgi:hypothetical protein
MSKPNIDIASKLLDESQTIEDKVNLANEINLAFLEPQKSYLKLSPSCKINTSLPRPQALIKKFHASHYMKVYMK